MVSHLHSVVECQGIWPRQVKGAEQSELNTMTIVFRINLKCVLWNFLELRSICTRDSLVHKIQSNGRISIQHIKRSFAFSRVTKIVQGPATSQEFLEDQLLQSHTAHRKHNKCSNRTTNNVWNLCLSTWFVWVLFRRFREDQLVWACRQYCLWVRAHTCSRTLWKLCWRFSSVFTGRFAGM